MRYLSGRLLAFRLLALLAPFILVSGCGSLRLRLAMARVQKGYDALTVAIESHQQKQAAAIAAQLRAAFLDPRILGCEPYKDELRFRKLHDENLSALDAIRDATPETPHEALRVMRIQVGNACAACHAIYRPADQTLQAGQSEDG